MESVFQSKFYNIYTIGEKHPEEGEDCLQYKIFIKETCKARKPTAYIDRDVYSPIERGLAHAHEVAKEALTDHFIVGS